MKKLILICSLWSVTIKAMDQEWQDYYSTALEKSTKLCSAFNDLEIGLQACNPNTLPLGSYATVLDALNKSIKVAKHFSESFEASDAQKYGLSSADIAMINTNKARLKTQVSSIKEKTQILTVQFRDKAHLDMEQAISFIKLGIFGSLSLAGFAVIFNAVFFK